MAKGKRATGPQGERQGMDMIHSTVRKVGNSLVVTIPRESADEYNIKEGQKIAFTPIGVESRYVLRGDVQQALDELFEDPRHMEALNYLGQ